MATREDPAARARLRLRRAVGELLADLRQTRIDLGLAQGTVAAAAGMTRSAYARLELGQLEVVDPTELAAVCAVVGLDLRINAYPAGDPLRDHVSVGLLAVLREHLHPSLALRAEVPLPGSGERRAWDAIAIAPDGWVGFECISRFGAADATLRRANLKLSDDARVTRLALVVNDTTRNRDALRASLVTVRASLPLQTREVMRALRAGHVPPANGIVLLRPRPQAVHRRGKVVDGSAGELRKFVDKPVGPGGQGP
jgi:transcriptional regulator with XRE-family HTH domain